MSEITEQLKGLKTAQMTVDKMLELGHVVLKISGKTPTDSTELNGWILEPLYQQEDCSIGFKYTPHKTTGPFETHVHPVSKEYYIVVKGSILLNINGQNVRIVKESECCTVDKGDLHHCTPLSDDTKFIYICIPEDINFPSPTK